MTPKNNYLLCPTNILMIDCSKQYAAPHVEKYGLKNCKNKK